MDSKLKKIPAVQELREMLQLEGAIVTMGRNHIRLKSATPHSTNPGTLSTTVQW